MPTLAVTNFNVVCATLGGFVTIFGLVSHLFKEKLYLSDASGVSLSHNAANFIKPIEYANGSQEALNAITLYFSRLVLGVQLVIAGVQLPSRFLLKEWKTLSLLLGPGMTGMWLCTSVVIWGLVPNTPYLHALAVAACVTPTDPVLSNSIVMGKFADKNVPKPLQRVIIAESGANDGLGYPFLFVAVYLIQYARSSGADESGGTRTAMALWLGETWGYTIFLSVLYGIAVGWLAKVLLHWAEDNKYIDRESFLVFAVALALFIVGTCGMIGSDDVLACFIAGNVFTIDDWFRLETLDDSLHPTIDMLLNLSVFMWFGAVCPWSEFVHNDVIPFYRLVLLGLLVLLFRRIPVIFAMHKYISQIEDFRQAAFVGFFGPIGVSAIFYLYIALEYFHNYFRVDGKLREDAKHLADTMYVVVWFMVICSIVIHGLSIPLGKLGFYLPHTLSSTMNKRSDIEQDAVSIPFRDTIFAAASRVVPSLRNSNSSRALSRGRPVPPRSNLFLTSSAIIPNGRSSTKSLTVHTNPVTSPIGSPTPPMAPPEPSSSPPLLGVSLPTHNLGGYPGAGQSANSGKCMRDTNANSYGAISNLPSRPRLGSLNHSSVDTINCEAKWQD
uniref:Na(+)/H(+) antiporter 2 n=1 Tax=Coccidioides posadasii RMSCC 3488 TaxID=454284 RepID=A0A0J6F4X5_COCPO|nr:Na(+)/H(+) antiporter 2 [Coccidioides posadasii RMSCC 3488]